MREIQMVDLKNQYEKIKQEIDEAILSVINSTAFIRGPEVKLFEEELQSYLGVRNVISCGNGTDALQISMMAAGLKPGDEVITTDFTFIATLETIAVLGLTPVIVDPDPDNFNISVDEIIKAITPRTKAIIPVHLFGQCSDMESILEIAKNNNLLVLEDAAQAIGTDYLFNDGSIKKAGTMGNMGATSFFPSKNLGCFGDGGAVYTDDNDLAKKIRSIANHGMKIRYHYNDIGVNSRLDTIQAAILRVKLKHLDAYNYARKDVAGYYDEAFKGCMDIIIPKRENYSSHIFHQYTIRIRNNKRDALRKHLGDNGIPSMIYYPGPLHMQEAYRYLRYDDSDFPVTTSLCSEVLSLPVHTEMEEDQLIYICEKVLQFFERK
jgi:UDP-2-acetamido-2-deoxy-ribo-hexuluronate aminotransferase